MTTQVKLNSEWRHSLMVLATASSFILFQACEHFADVSGAEPHRTVAPDGHVRKESRPATKAVVHNSKGKGPSSASKTTGGQAMSEGAPSLLLGDRPSGTLCSREAQPRPNNFVTWLETRQPQSTPTLLAARPAPGTKSGSPQIVPASQKMVLQNPADSQLSKTVFVVTESLNIRQAPYVKAPVIGTLKRGSSFKVTVVNGWAKISDGQFVLAKYLSTKAPLADLKMKKERRLAAR